MLGATSDGRERSPLVSEAPCKRPKVIQHQIMAIRKLHIGSNGTIMGLKTGAKHTISELWNLLFDSTSIQEVLAASDLPESGTNLPKEEFLTPFLLVQQ